MGGGAAGGGRAGRTGRVILHRNGVMMESMDMKTSGDGIRDACPSSRGRRRPGRSTRRARLGNLLAGVLSIAAAPGCAGGKTAGQVEWGTKQRSILAREPVALQEPSAAPRPPRAEIDAGSAAVGLLLQATNASHPLLRANAIEALHPVRAAVAEPARRALADENEGVRFVAAMTVGRLRLEDEVHLVEPLLDDPSPSVQAAAIYALRRCDRRANPTVLATMLASSDPGARGNAAMILGELGDPSAIEMLREAGSQRSLRMSPASARVVELQIAEAMVRLGDDQQIEVIRAALFAPEKEGEITALACAICGEIGDQAYAPTLADIAMRTGLRQEATEVRIAAAQAVGRISAGSAGARAVVSVPLEFLTDADPMIRAQAAAAVGHFQEAEHEASLAVLLGDKDPFVQIAAAGAILRIRGAARGDGEEAAESPATTTRVDTNHASR
jgi:HEAT repeat protein